MGIIRKLEIVLQGLEPLVEQGKIVGFFTNVSNADKLGDLAGDIRDAMMDYQVRPWNSRTRLYLMSASDVITTTSIQ